MIPRWARGASKDLTRYVRDGDEFCSESLMGCRVVPLLSGAEEGW